MQDNFTPNVPEPKIGQLWAGVENLNLQHYERLAEKHLQCALIYSVNCTRVLEDLKVAKIISNEEWILLLRQATELEYLYLHYLDNKPEAKRFRNDRSIFQEKLNSYSFTDPTPLDNTAITQSIYDLHPHVNIVRLTLVRTNKLLTVVAGMQELSYFAEVMKKINNNPLLQHIIHYQAWIFFVPRLLTSLLLLLKHAIPCSYWMREQNERNLSLRIRMAAFWQQHWFAIANDTLWFTMGVLNCFVFSAASLTNIGLAISLTLFVFDIVLAAIRTGIDLSRVYSLENKFDDLYLAPRKAYEVRKQVIYLINTVLLAVGMMLTMPVFGFGLMASLIGAALVLVTTLANYFATNLNDKTKPADIYSFFKPETISTRGNVESKSLN